MRVEILCTIIPLTYVILERNTSARSFPGSLHSSRRDIDFMVMVVDRFESKPFNRRSYPWSGLTKQA